ncbi:MAG: hypothetical protein JO316_22125 [Abitibacteriaceae bacterium]|nr:hypothetical protein [Abditibacteriaceae bacterium]
MLEALLWALRADPVEALIYIVLWLLVALPTAALAVVIVMLLFFSITAPFRERRTCLVLGQTPCPFCGVPLGLKAAQQAAKGYNSTHTQRREQDSKARSRYIQEWTVVCPHCGRESYFDYIHHTLYERRWPYRDLATGILVRNCDIAFRRNCPSRWKELEPTTEEEVRLCPVCWHQVFHCVAPEQALEHAEQGHIVAREWPDFGLRQFADADDVPIEDAARYHQEAEALERESNIDSALDNVQYTQRRCCNCCFPVPEWWKQCRVCSGEQYQFKKST